MKDIDKIKDINKKIIALTMSISVSNPELMDFFNEMNITLPDINNPKIDLYVLTDYYNSLFTLRRNYLTIYRF